MIIFKLYNGLYLKYTHFIIICNVIFKCTLNKLLNAVHKLKYNIFQICTVLLILIAYEKI